MGYFIGRTCSVRERKFEVIRHIRLAELFTPVDPLAGLGDGEFVGWSGSGWGRQSRDNIASVVVAPGDQIRIGPGAVDRIGAENENYLWVCAWAVRQADPVHAAALDQPVGVAVRNLVKAALAGSIDKIEPAFVRVAVDALDQARFGDGEPDWNQGNVCAACDLHMERLLACHLDIARAIRQQSFIEAGVDGLNLRRAEWLQRKVLCAGAERRGNEKAEQQSNSNSWRGCTHWRGWCRSDF